MKIELQGEDIDSIIVEDLKESIKRMLKKNYDVYETLDNKATLFANLCATLKYHSTLSDYNEFISSLEGKKLR